MIIVLLSMHWLDATILILIDRENEKTLFYKFVNRCKISHQALEISQ